MLDQILPIDSNKIVNQLKDEGVQVLFVIFGDALDNNDVEELKGKANVLIRSKNLNKNSDEDGVGDSKDILNSVEGSFNIFLLLFLYLDSISMNCLIHILLFLWYQSTFIFKKSILAS